MEVSPKAMARSPCLDYPTSERPGYVKIDFTSFLELCDLVFLM